MKIALTHEQGDFDAIASLLGTVLLEKETKPVLPRRYNRNVRSYLTLYQNELPFWVIKDLPQEPIDLIKLVDTQSMVTLKHMSKDTHVTVVDHHDLRPNLPAEWSVEIQELGACTTLFVESIKQKKVELSVVQATLLLLGIYEDTGSLTYTRTTVRDVHAAAYLLEHGASLYIAGDYLYPPLSSEQRLLYDQLLTNTETHHVHGQEIILACAFAEEMTDEVASTAHKLRDLLEPDALVIIISTSEGIRLVARSTSRQVDVSAIAAHFGGGGHKRAAAALIRMEEMGPGKDRRDAVRQIHDELLNVLPRYVQPAITVGEIMSTRPLLLSPRQSASEASILMQRYGYEGFPVVDNGRVVGLLTRRSVDRALAHKLDLKVESLMEAGEVTICPEQTLEDLHNTMNNTGWWQIPVVDPVEGKVIGIVTRTDLIKTMSNGTTNIPGKQNLSKSLEKALPKAHLVLLKRIAEHASLQNLPLYIVGGFVRDLLLEHPSLDFDLVVEGNAISLAQTLQEKYGGKVVSHKRFGTAKWRLEPLKEPLASELSFLGHINPNDLPVSLDLISARTEFYDRPTALPVVERSSIKLDLHRRDFSINTLALRLDGEHYGELYDYWGGLNDLDNGFIRVLHSLSFVDDPTRLLRAVRFEQRFNFNIEVRTLQLMQEAHSLMRQVSGDRIRHELDAILDEPKATLMLQRLDELKLLVAISTDLTWSPQIQSRVETVLQQTPQEWWNLPERAGNTNFRRQLIYLAWFVHLPLESIKSIGNRLRMSKKLMIAIDEIHKVKACLNQLDAQKPSDFVKAFEGSAETTLYVIYHQSDQYDIKNAIENYIIQWHKVKPLADGETLKRYNILPGPIYRQILERLRNAWLDGEIHTQAEENLLLSNLVREINPL